MPSLTRRLVVVGLYLAGIVVAGTAVFRVSGIGACFSDAGCPERQSFGAGIYAMAFVGGGLWIVVAGLRGRLIGARTARPGPSRRGGWWFRVKAVAGASTGLALFLALLITPPQLVFPGIMIATTYAAQAGASSVVVGLLWMPFVMAIATALFVWVGVPSGRILLRLTPPRPGRRPRAGALAIAVAAAFLVMLQGSLAAGVQGDMAPGAMIGDAAMGIRPTLVEATFGLTAAWVLGLLIPVFSRHLRPDAFAHAPFVLVLRRFSSYADRAVLREVLAARPVERQVVLLTPTRSQGGDWDPIQIGFSGLSWRAPVRSVPVYLRTMDDNWESVAREYIGRARRIVLDASEESEAIQVETRLIDELGRWKDTLVLTTPTGRSRWPDGATVVVYRRSWLRALPRLFFGVLATVGLMLGAGRVGVVLAQAAPLLLVVLSPMIAAVYLYFFLTFLLPALDAPSAHASRDWARRRALPADGGARGLSRPDVLALAGVALLAAGTLAGAVSGDVRARVLIMAACAGVVYAVLRRRPGLLAGCAALSTLVLVLTPPRALVISFAGMTSSLLEELPWSLPRLPIAWCVAMLGTLMLFLGHRLGEAGRGVQGRGESRKILTDTPAETG